MPRYRGKRSRVSAPGKVDATPLHQRGDTIPSDTGDGSATGVTGATRPSASGDGSATGVKRGAFGTSGAWARMIGCGAALAAGAATIAGRGATVAGLGGIIGLNGTAPAGSPPCVYTIGGPPIIGEHPIGLQPAPHRGGAATIHITAGNAASRKRSASLRMKTLLPVMPPRRETRSVDARGSWRAASKRDAP
jgi:hypothetical protein